ncbi:MAG: hypothetical protein JXK94_03465 [Deltaproteobacteria bacterium]|nr:hypothetical protein [Deltaproteobacteria bacterium]
MKGFGKILILLSILCSILLGVQIVAYFGAKLGFAILSLLFMGGIALSLVLSGTNNGQEDLFMEEFLEDFREN